MASTAPAGPSQGGDAGALREAGRAGVRVHHQLVDGFDQPGGHHAVAHAPAGHGVGLREAVQDDGLLEHAGQAGDRDAAARRSRCASRSRRTAPSRRGRAPCPAMARDVVRGDDSAGRVLRRVQDQQLGAVGQLLSQAGRGRRRSRALRPAAWAPGMAPRNRIIDS